MVGRRARATAFGGAGCADDGVDAARALALVKSAPDEALELVEIGPAIDRVANDDESLERPVGAPIRAAVRETLF